MSGVGHAFKKVAHGVGKVIRRIWKPLVIAAAIYFTGSYAGWWGSGAAASAGSDAFAGSVAEGSASTVWLGSSGLASSGLASSGLAAGAGSTDTLGMFVPQAASGATAGSIAASGGSYAPIDLSSSAGVGGSVGSSAVGSAAAGSSGWDTAKTMAGKVMSGGKDAFAWLSKNPAAWQMMMGAVSGVQQAQQYNDQKKWMEAHAPGQIKGGVKNAFTGFADPSGFDHGQYRYAAPQSAEEQQQQLVAGQLPNFGIPAATQSPYARPMIPGQMSGQMGGQDQRGAGLMSYGDPFFGNEEQT